MKFPLNRKPEICGYHLGQWTFYGVRHRGTDWCAVNEPLYAPEDSQIVKQYHGWAGGNWIHLKSKSGILYKFAHLSRFFFGLGNWVRQGDKIALTGRTGVLCRGYHLHMEIWNGNKQINPEIYFKTMKFIKEKNRNEVYAVINKRNYYVGGEAFNDLIKEGLAEWNAVVEVNYQINLDGIIK